MEIVDAVCWFRCPDCWRCVEKDIEMLRDFACFEYCCTNCCAVSVVLFVDFFYILSLYILYTYLEIRLKEIYSSTVASDSNFCYCFFYDFLYERLKRQPQLWRWRISPKMCIYLFGLFFLSIFCARGIWMYIKREVSCLSRALFCRWKLLIKSPAHRPMRDCCGIRVYIFRFFVVL